MRVLMIAQLRDPPDACSCPAAYPGCSNNSRPPCRRRPTLRKSPSHTHSWPRLTLVGRTRTDAGSRRAALPSAPTRPPITYLIGQTRRATSATSSAAAHHRRRRAAAAAAAGVRPARARGGAAAAGVAAAACSARAGPAEVVGRLREGGGPAARRVGGPNGLVRRFYKSRGKCRKCENVRLCIEGVRSEKSLALALKSREYSFWLT